MDREKSWKRSMIEEIFPNIFRMKLPLPHSPLGHVNSYLVRSDDRNLLIDTGLNFPQTYGSLRRGLSEAGIGPEGLTEILLTHFHVDHVGLVPRFREASKKVRLSIHGVEAELSKAMSIDDFKGSVATFLKSSGAPSFFALNSRTFRPTFFNPRAYEELAVAELRLDDGQVISVGEYDFHILWTPGHSPGHICLYEPSLRILISGDTLLPTITPHIGVWWFMENMDPLTDFLDSLAKIERLDVEVVLPGHEEIFTDYRERIRELRDHHEQRLNEIMEGLMTERSTAYMLASEVHWNVDQKCWDELSPFQKYLALGEVVAHLDFLEREGRVKRTEIDGIVFYRIDERNEDE